jgi:TolB-like protein/Tfp pilus assembly protein PilF
MRLFSELRRRNVFRMAVLYVVAAWLIMQVAEVVIALANLPDWIGPAVLGLLAVGFPIALILSWFYELTPEGISLEVDVEPGESITHITGRRMDFIVIALLAAAVILFSLHTWWPSAPLDRSIAVLPFANMSADPEQEYFSDGISEELLSALSKLPGLRVAARTSSFQFKGENRDIADIGTQLNVAFILDGSVRRAGTQVRITTQLIDARNGFHVWSDTYDRELDSIFAVQDEISTAIVDALKEQLGLQVAAVPTVIAAANTEAHDAYLRGRYLVVQRTAATIEGAVREFEKAVELDPEYALAHAELAIAILLLPAYGDLPVTEAITTAAPYAERAIKLDPMLAEANAAIGFLSFVQYDSEAALAYYRQAIKINPNYAIVYTWIGNLLDGMGRHKERFAMSEMAMRLDPLSLPARINHVEMLINRNRFAEAEIELEKLASIQPSWYASSRGILSSLGGNWANAVLAFLDAWRLAPQSLGVRSDLSLLFAILGLEKEAMAIADRPPPRALSMLGRPLDAVRIAEAIVADDPSGSVARRDLGRALAGAGDYPSAQPYLEEIWQLAGGRKNALFDINSAAALIDIRYKAGDVTGASELLAAIQDDVQRLREAGITARYGLFNHVDFEDGLATYLSGGHSRGLALIARAVEDGFFIPHSEAYLHVLYRDPEFPRIRDMQEALQTRERNRFLAIVCDDNPYASVWQPASGTCEHFAAAVGN